MSVMINLSLRLQSMHDSLPMTGGTDGADSDSPASSDNPAGSTELRTRPSNQPRRGDSRPASGPLARAQTGIWWSWVTVVLFLHLPADMGTTLAAIHQVGLAPEANPLMEWLYSQSLPGIIAVHLLLTVVLTGVFAGQFGGVQRSPPPVDRLLAYAVEGQLALLTVFGLILVANNTLVTLTGQSLETVLAQLFLLVATT